MAHIGAPTCQGETAWCTDRESEFFKSDPHSVWPSNFSYFCCSTLDLGKLIFQIKLIAINFEIFHISLWLKSLQLQLVFFAQVYSTEMWVPSEDMRLARAEAGDVGPWWEKEDEEEG